LITLPKVEIREGESFEAAMRKFKKQIEQDGILKEVRDRKHYQKPSEKKRKKMRERR
jgi:small subunit ribosomal protein S21